MDMEKSVGGEEYFYRCSLDSLVERKLGVSMAMNCIKIGVPGIEVEKPTSLTFDNTEFIFSNAKFIFLAKKGSGVIQATKVTVHILH